MKRPEADLQLAPGVNILAYLQQVYTPASLVVFTIAAATW